MCVAVDDGEQEGCNQPDGAHGSLADLVRAHRDQPDAASHDHRQEGAQAVGAVALEAHRYLFQMLAISVLASLTSQSFRPSFLAITLVLVVGLWGW